MIEQEKETLETLYQIGDILDYAYDEGEDGCFYWVQTHNEEWEPLPHYLNTNRRN